MNTPSDQPLRLEVRKHNSIMILHVAGEVDGITAHELRDTLLTIISGCPPTLVVDLEEVFFIDSIGWGRLVDCQARASSLNVELRLVVTERRRRELNIMGLDQLFIIHDDLHSAISATEGH